MEMKNTKLLQRKEPSQIKWTQLQLKIAELLSDGYSQVDTAEKLGCRNDYICRLMSHPEFNKYVNKLTLNKREAAEAEALRVIRMNIRKKMNDSRKDVLDWIDILLNRKGTNIQVSAEAKAEGTGAETKDNPFDGISDSEIRSIIALADTLGFNSEDSPRPKSKITQSKNN